MIISLLFYCIAALIIFTALKMVLSTNLIHSALFMAATFMGIAMIFILLNADYLAIVQVMVYVGAISILFVFGVMLTKEQIWRRAIDLTGIRYMEYCCCSTISSFYKNIFSCEFISNTAGTSESTILAISTLLLKDYSIAFEVSGFYCWLQP